MASQYPKISVIVPVYNVEQYLPRCIDSILSQTFTDFELLLIDDGSKDNSGKICDDYSKKDARIRVFHKENGGVSSARNVGIEESYGSWLTFVDSDDYIDHNFFLYFVNKLESNLFDYFQGNVEQIDISGSKKIEYKYSNTICTLEEGITNYNLLETGDPHAKFFKKDILNKHNIRFNKAIRYGEDRLFVDTYFCYIEKICLSSVICYYYFRVVGGLSYKLNTFESELLCMRLMLKVLKILSEKAGVNYYSIINLTPAYRTIKSLVIQKKIKSFNAFLLNLNSEELYSINKACEHLKLGKIFVWLLNNQYNRVLYFSLRLYFNLKSAVKCKTLL